jgi:hypothetical protein
MPKLTEYFSRHIQPSIIGVYQVDDEDGWPADEWYSFWDGKKFCYRGDSPEVAFARRFERTDCGSSARWRGLASDPSKEKA